MEVNDFRDQMRDLAEESLANRMKGQNLEKLRYQCPPRLADQSVPTTLKSKLNRNSFMLVTKFANSEVSDSISTNLHNTIYK